MYGLFKDAVSRLHEALGQRRVGVYGSEQFLYRRFTLKGNASLGDEVGGMRTDNMDTQ